MLAMTRPTCRPSLRRHPGHPRVTGFTLIEILVTIALMAITMMIAAPSFIAFQRNSELSSTANSFLATLAAARAEAMKRGMNGYVVPATGGNWASGWIAYLDVDSSGTLNETVDTVISRQPALPASVAVGTDSAASGFVDGSETYVRFNGSGYPSLKSGGFSGGALQLTNGNETRRVVLNAVGRMRVCKASQTDCTQTGF